MNSRAGVVLAILLCATSIAAAAQNRPKLELRGKETTAIPRASDPIHIDGVLDEPAWKNAAKIDRFYEWFPGDNIEPVVRTECFVTYDTSKIYIAFRAWDPEPRRIRANLTDRDAAFQDDTVGFFLDPFADGRRGFQFRINPLGVQMDGINSDVDGSEDWSWDTIWGDEDDWYRQIEIELNADRIEDHNGLVTDNGQDLEASILLGHQTFVELTLSPNEEYYEGTTYDNLRKAFYAESRPTRDSYVYLYYNWGETIDFANSRGADFQTLEPSFELLLARRFAVGATWTHQKLDVEGGELYNVELLQTKLVWNFSVRSFARVILQYSDLTRNPELYTFPVDRASEDLFTQALFSYKINPQTVFLVGYSDNYFGDQSIDLTQADRTLFVKLGYAWVF